MDKPHDFPPLVDVSAIPVADLIDGDTAVSRVVARLVESLDDPDGVISAFSSYASA